MTQKTISTEKSSEKPNTRNAMPHSQSLVALKSIKNAVTNSLKPPNSHQNSTIKSISK